MRFLLDESLRLDSWQLEADTLASIDSKIQILLRLIDVHVLLLVNSFRKDGVLNCYVHEFGKDNTSFHNVEQVFVFGVDRKNLLAFFVLFEELIHKLGKANLFFYEIGVSETTLTNTLRYLTIRN